MAFTPNQWAIVVLVLVAGWLLGLASHPGGRRWRERYTAERDAHAAMRRDLDARAAAAEDRARAVEAERDRLARSAPAPVIAPAAGRAAPAARPAYPGGERRGWFDWGARTPTNG